MHEVLAGNGIGRGVVSGEHEHPRCDVAAEQLAEQHALLPAERHELSGAPKRAQRLATFDALVRGRHELRPGRGGGASEEGSTHGAKPGQVVGPPLALLGIQVHDDPLDVERRQPRVGQVSDGLVVHHRADEPLQAGPSLG